MRRLPVGGVRPDTQVVDRALKHVLKVGGRTTLILATLIWKVSSRSVSKSIDARASLVCSSMPRRPFQPPNWTSRLAR